MQMRDGVLTVGHVSVLHSSFLVLIAVNNEREMFSQARVPPGSGRMSYHQLNSLARRTQVLKHLHRGSGIGPHL